MHSATGTSIHVFANVTKNETQLLTVIPRSSFGSAVPSTLTRSTMMAMIAQTLMKREIMLILQLYQKLSLVAGRFLGSRIPLS